METYVFHLSPGNLVTNTLLLEFFSLFQQLLKLLLSEEQELCV